MKKHNQGEGAGCYSISYSGVSITQVSARCQPGMLLERSHVLVARQPQQLGTQPQTRHLTASSKARKQQTKSQPGSPWQQNLQISSPQQIHSGLRRGIRPSPSTCKTCSNNPERGVCRNGGAPPRVLVMPQRGGYRGQVRGQS